MLELDGEAEWSQEGPTLSNDIWKKFQLIPTPPRSPSHDTDLSLSPLDFITFSDLDLPPFEWEGLESDDFGLDLGNLLPDHLPSCGGPGGLPCAHGTCNSCTQLALAGSELRHDCMWRGTCTAEAHTHQMKDMHRSHKESTSNYQDVLLESSVFESSAAFTHLDDLQEDDDEDMEDLEAEDDLAGRPDTPSESSETDTDEDQEDEDEDTEEDEEDGEDAPAIHVDHSYYCPRAPSPRHAHAPALPHTPSESEDEIDVVSVGSTDSAYSSSSSRYGGKNITIRSSEKRKLASTTASVASRTSGGDPTSMTVTTPTPAIPSATTPALPTAAATTTFVTTSSPRKILKIRPITQTTIPSSSKSRHNREKRRATSTSNTSSTSNITINTNSTENMPNPAAVSTTSTTTPSPTNANAPYTTRPLKRIHRATTSSHHHSHHHGRKRKNHRGYDDDPERRHLHNSLERMRRVDLRNAFEDLRNLVPDLCEREKAPKVEILRRASEHCYSLTQRGRLLEQEKEKQKRLQSELRRRLAALHKQHGRL